MNKKLISIIMIGLLLLTGLTGISAVGTGSDNNPPETPSKPDGPDYGEPPGRYRFWTNTTDPDGDMVKYGWDFFGNGTVDVWTDFYPSGRSVYYSWSWQKAGTYNISVKAEDVNGSQSNFSEAKTIIINNPPYTPGTPWGPTSCHQNLKYTYYADAYEIDGDQLWFKWDWGESFSDWMGPYNSMETINATHIWKYKGNYQITIKCKDSKGGYSEWSEPLYVDITDLVKIRTPMVNIGKVSAIISNKCEKNLTNICWNLSIKRNRLIRNINISENGVIDELKSGEKIRLSTESRIVRKFGLVEIEVDVSIPELDGEPYKRTIKVYGFILGRIIIVPPIYLFY